MAQNWDWTGAEEQFLKSIELSPNYAIAHQRYGSFLSSAGKHSEAVAEQRLGYQLDPASPLFAAILAQALARNGQIQESIDLAARIGAQYPDNARVLMGLARVYGTIGRYDDELAAAEQMGVAEGNKVIAAMFDAAALAHLGRRDEARRLVEDSVSGADAATFPAVFTARAYAALNDLDRTIEWLTVALDTRDPWAWRLRMFPEFDALESDPSYQALLRRMNFPE
jgi:tetratricopeptide (TPR) repeat protein